MDDATLRNQIGSNIAAYRKQAGLTQAGLAEKLNYSDKAISKWERGESVPDVLTLMQLGQLFGVTMDALVSSDSPAGAGLQEPERPTARKGIIQALEEKLGAKLYICDEAQLCGALGAALFAYEKCNAAL